MCDDQDENARRYREAYARSHPIRVSILELYAQDKGRPLAVEALFGDLADESLKPPVVAYHLRVLREAGLLPEV